MKFFKIGILSIIAMAVFIFSGCENNTSGTGLPSKVKITTKTQKVTVKSINYNLDGAAALATTWVDEVQPAPSVLSSSRAAESAITKKANKSLKKVVKEKDANDKDVYSEQDVISVTTLSSEQKDRLKTKIADIKDKTTNLNEALKDLFKDEGIEVEVVEETEVKEVSITDGTNVSTDEVVFEDALELKEGFELQPVRQVYQSPYTDIDEGAKGVYIAYAWYSEWEYTNGTPVKFGSLVYVRNDGTSSDIFIDSKGVSNYKLVPAFWMKSSDDEDYLQFDQSGHMFVAAKDENNVVSIYKYEPIGGTLSKVLPDIQGLSIRNFRVSEDGKWLFLNAMVNNSNHVYAVPTYRPQDYIALYENNTEEWSVENVVVTSDRTVYFFVNDYAGGRRTSGLYKCKFDFANNTYSKDFVENETTLPMWAFEEDLFVYNYDELGNRVGDHIGIEAEFKKGNDSQKIDYGKLLKFIFSFCDPSVEKEFRLDKAFAEYTGDNYDWFYGNLYTEEKDEDALEFIFKNNETDNLFWILQCYCYDDTRKDDGTFKGGRGRFPFERFVFKKGTDETAYTVSPAYYNTAFGSTDTTGGILLSNNEGVFVLKPDHWVQSTVKAEDSWFDCSTVVKVVDNNGNYVFETPDALKHFECPAPRKEYVYVDPTQKDWYKKPFQTNKDGIFIYNKKGTEVWYYTNGKALNLLANDYTFIEKINSFFSDDASITFNASDGTDNFTHKIDLATREVVDYKLSGDFTQVIEVNTKASKPKDTSVKVSIEFEKIEDLNVSISNPVNGKITLTADKNYVQDGFTENFSNYKWSCLGKVLNIGEDGKVNGGAYYIEIDTSNYTSGTYPILVIAEKKDKTHCSCFFNLIIE